MHPVSDVRSAFIIAIDGDVCFRNQAFVDDTAHCSVAVNITHDETNLNYARIQVRKYSPKRLFL